MRSIRPAFGVNLPPQSSRCSAKTCLDAYHAGGSLGVARLWLPALGDLLYGALAEHAALLTLSLKGSAHMLQYRRSASMIFAAFIAFVIVGIGFQKSSEDIMKSALPTTYPLLAVSYYAMMAGAIVALLAVLIGGIPIAFAALRYALANRRRDILARFMVPPIALLVILADVFVVVSLNIGGNTAATIHTPARFAGIGSVVRPLHSWRSRQRLCGTRRHRPQRYQ